MAQTRRYLASILHNYLLDKRQATLDLNANRPASFNRVDGVHSYLLLSENISTKASRIFQSVDKYISQKQKELLISKQIQPGRSESLGLMVSRLIMLIKYNSANSQLMRSLLEYVLMADRLYHSELIILLRLLNNNLAAEGQTNRKLIGLFREAIHQYLEKNSIINYPYRYISMLSKMSVLPRSFLFGRLTYNLFNDLDRFMQRGDPYHLHQTMTVSCRKSSELLMRLGLRENSLFKKRLIYEMIANRMGIDSAQYELPGKLCRSYQQVIQKSNFLGLLTENEQMFAYSTRIQQSGEDGNRVVQLRVLVDSLFCVMESGNGKIEIGRLNYIVNKLNSIRQTQTNILQALINKNGDYLAKFMMIVTYLNVHLVNHQPSTIISRDFISSTASANINAIHFYNQLRQSPIFIPYLLLQCLSNIAPHRYQQYPQLHLNLQRIGEIIKQQNRSADRKKYTTLKQIYDYTNLWLKTSLSPQSHKLTQLLSSQASHKALLRLVELNQQKNQQAALKIMNVMGRVTEKWQFTKNVHIQPNIHLSYCFVDRGSKLPLVCFESAQNSQRYVVRNRSVGDELIDQSCDLNLYGIWKRQFLREIYGCEYYCCNDESQLAHKICAFILRNSEELNTA